MMKLDISLINWENIYKHPSELIRLDEVLRLKQANLSNFSCTNPGWSITASNEIMETKKMVNNMRCFVYHNAHEIFPNMVDYGDDYQCLKTFNVKPIQQTGKLKRSEELWYLISAHCDRRNTEKCYRHLLEKMADWSKNPWEEDQQKTIDMIISKVTFTID